eukprot:CAMPEP_0182539366 /NCGR_PEP_ID=MMETSP1323-20130603/25277_1 /TAXON_ID=236787 /ORGANISM="Florenciella parvula, Strain RCC1693" /LENGTH=34 /DNA_ID= /DNA_START= /DNA_END= /DNA_ORIENTATION=
MTADAACRAATVSPASVMSGMHCSKPSMATDPAV